MERFGIVGLPNAGKSSLFNALTGGNAAVAAHPFSTTETNVGVAKVPDHRLVALAEMSASKKVVEATAEFADIASRDDHVRSRYVGNCAPQRRDGRPRLATATEG
jgi:ribosome-binding ATPase YchF (GTP1/OBG family)